MNLDEAKKLPRQRKLLLVTVTAIEAKAVADCFDPKGHGRKLDDARQPYRWLGQRGNYHLFTVTSPQMGSDTAQNLAHGAFDELDPGFLIAVGIAFGAGKPGQMMGHVLVSDFVQGYDIARLEPNLDITYRQRPVPASVMLVHQFVDLKQHGCGRQWGGHWPMIHVGTLLSGGKLIDNIDYRNSLLKQWPDAIGGEMEGIGIASAANFSAIKREWIIVKGICDWADGNKHTTHKNLHQRVAAWNAALCVRAVFDLDGLAELLAPDDVSAFIPTVPPQLLHGSATDQSVCLRLVAAAIPAFKALPETERMHFLAAWGEPLACVADVQATLTTRGALGLLDCVQRAIRKAYHGAPSAKLKPPAAVAVLLTQITLVGLERRMLDKGAMATPDAAGVVALAVDSRQIESGAILAAMSLNTGVRLEFDPDTGSPRMAHRLDLPPVIPGERTADDGLRAEVFARVRAHGLHGLGASRNDVDSFRDWVRDNGVPGDDVIALYASRYEEDTGVKLLVGLPADAASPALTPALLDSFCVRAFRFRGPDKLEEETGKRLAEIANYLDDLAQLMHR